MGLARVTRVCLARFRGASRGTGGGKRGGPAGSAGAGSRTGDDVPKRPLTYPLPPSSGDEFYADDGDAAPRGSSSRFNNHSGNDDDDDDDDEASASAASPARVPAWADVVQEWTSERLLKLTKPVLLEMCSRSGIGEAHEQHKKKELVELMIEKNGTGLEEDAAHTQRRRPARLTPALLGLGGLEDVVAQLNGRVWLPLTAPRAAVHRLDAQAPLAILLSGPPGCGKSLLAVRLARLLNPDEDPVVVKGPEIKNAMWGGAESNIRSLFAPVLKTKKHPGDIRVTILDESESILSRRSSHDFAKHETSIVTQFLSCMDGAAQRLADEGGKVNTTNTTTSTPTNNNLKRTLLVACTNAPELIDLALLRPGRFEVQISLPLPDERARRSIATLETARVRATGALADCADAFLDEFAVLSHGFSGADVAGTIRRARNMALERYVEQRNAATASDVAPNFSSSPAPDDDDPKKKAKNADGAQDAKLTREDLVAALNVELDARTVRFNRAHACDGHDDNHY